MSYSFSVKGATKAEAIAAAVEQLEQVERNQPVHAADMPAAKAAVESFTNLLMDDPNSDCGLSVSGSVYIAAEGLRQVSLSFNAGFNPPRGS